MLFCGIPKIDLLINMFMQNEFHIPNSKTLLVQVDRRGWGGEVCHLLRGKWAPRSHKYGSELEH